MRYQSLFSIIALLIIGSAAHCAPARLYVVPQDVSLAMGVTQQFQVVCEDEDGNEITPPAPVTWSASGAGSITSTGLFTAGNTPGQYQAAITVSAAGGLSAKANIGICNNEQHGGYMLERSVGSLEAGKYNSPLDVTLDSAGNLYVVNQQESCVSKFDASGNYIRQVKLSFTPTSNTRIAVDSSGNVYVLDAENNRVQRYSPSGSMLQWGSAGSGDGQFNNPADIAVDSQGLVYISDAGNYQIQVFSANGSFVRKWDVCVYYYAYTIYPTMPGELAIDAADNLYVTTWLPDWDSRLAILHYNSQGTFLSAINMGGVGDPADFALDSAKNVYLLLNSQVMKFDSMGDNLLSCWGGYGSAPGQFLSIGGFAVSPSGKVYVSDNESNRIQAFDSTGQLLSSWASSGSQKGQFKYPSGLALDNTGNLYVADVGNGRIQKFDANGRFLQELCSKQQGDSVFACAGGITVDSANNLCLSDLLEEKLLTYDSSGQITGNYFLSGPVVWTAPLGLVRTRVSPYDFFITDATMDFAITIDNTGCYASGWGDTVTGESTLVSPAGITTNSQELTIIADYGNNHVQVYRGGPFDWGFGAAGSGNGEFQGPAGVCVDSSDNIYVVDNGNCRVQKFSPTGVFASKLGSKGYGAFQFLYPECVVVSANNAIYVSDTYNHRVLKFVPAPPASDIRGAKLGEINSAVNINGAIVTAAYPDFFYIEADNRANGVRVDKTAHGMQAGSRANVAGTMQTNSDGERFIAATSVSPAGTGSVAPIAMNNKTLGGGDWNFDSSTGAGQSGITSERGVNNIGLLVKIYGRVTNTGSGFFYVDDGSRCADAAGNLGVKVLTNGFTPPPAGSYVQVTGISSCYCSAQKFYRLLRTRTQNDVVLKKGAVIKGLISGTGGGGVVSTLIESPHPYANSSNTTWTITGPSSATQMRVHFTQLALEYNKDFLYLKKGTGTIAYTYNVYSTLTDEWSPWIPTNVLKLTLTANSLNNNYGFQVDKYESDATSGTGPAAGVTVTLNPGGISAVTAADGTYAAAVPQAGTYTLTPSFSGMTFTPTSKTVTVTDGQVLTGVDFTVN